MAEEVSERFDQISDPTAEIVLQLDTADYDDLVSINSLISVKDLPLVNVRVDVEVRSFMRAVVCERELDN